MIDNYRHWHEKLPFALLGYRTTVRTSTGAMPYFLVYGTEVVLPTEVEIPSLRVIQEIKLSNEEWVKNRYEQLMLIDENRMNTVCHCQLYQNRMARAFNKKVKPRQFKPGQLIFKIAEAKINNEYNYQNHWSSGLNFFILFYRKLHLLNDDNPGI
ncbi:uncharacterized protein LOC142176094 [Nicotiana tabacum]|uniref:Uncharacterized protein LOC142176094 n=1 Tax=Nicotiana tabacum TaxID=4097 RepID=A0AC58TPV6_TOBAC